MLLIRVDASESVGLGHLMRCLTIAEHFLLKNIKVTVLTKSKNLKALIINNSIELVLMPDDIKVDDELKTIESLVSKKKINLILLDVNNFYSFQSLESYDYYLKCLKNLSLFLLSFEDPHNCVHSSDVIIIPYLDSEKQEITKRQNSKYLLGLKYYVLRSEFLAVKPVEIKKEIKNILITMGGCDNNNITLKVLESLNTLNFNLTIIIGKMFKNIEPKIKNILDDYQGSYKLIKNTRNISKIMSESDIAIINSGLTKYETASIGLPSVVISNNDYHSELMKDFDKYNVILHLGTVDKLKNSVILDSVNLLSKDFKKRQIMSANGKVLIDGYGVERIFSKIPKKIISKFL